MCFLAVRGAMKTTLPPAAMLTHEISALSTCLITEAMTFFAHELGYTDWPDYDRALEESPQEVADRIVARGMTEVETTDPLRCPVCGHEAERFTRAVAPPWQEPGERTAPAPPPREVVWGRCRHCGAEWIVQEGACAR